MSNVRVLSSAELAAARAGRGDAARADAAEQVGGLARGETELLDLRDRRFAATAAHDGNRHDTHRTTGDL